MDYLYRETTISNPADSVLVLKNHLVVHHHNTIKVFDHSLNLVRKKYFYEKILGIRRTSENELIILFKGGKLLQCNIHFVPRCLRIVHGESIDVYNETCMVYGKSVVEYFNVNSKEIREINLIDIEIYKSKCARFMRCYIPTLLIYSVNGTSSRCTLMSLDIISAKIDEFEVIDNPLCFDGTEKFIVFANRNFLQIKFKREIFVFPLNENFNVSVLKKELQENLPNLMYDGSEKSKSIFLEDPQLFFREEVIYVLNGNSELFSFRPKIDSKKISSVMISFEGKFNRPSCIDTSETLLFIGSKLDDTILYSFTQQDDDFLCENSRIQNIGVVTGFSSKTSVLATTKAIYKAAATVELMVYKKSKVEGKLKKIVCSDSGLQVITNDSVFNVSLEDLEVSKDGERIDAECNISEMGEYSFKYDQGILEIISKGVIKRTYERVDHWHYREKRLAILSRGTFLFIEIPSFKTLFSTRQINFFEEDILNEEILGGAELEEIENFDHKVLEAPDKARHEGLGSNEEIDLANGKIVEFFMAGSPGGTFYFLFRTAKQLYIYRNCLTRLIKVFISKPLCFENETKALFDVGMSLYCRSKRPCFIVFKSDVYFYETPFKLGYPVIINGWLYAYSKGHVLKCKIATEMSRIFTETLILEEVHSVEDLIKSDLDLVPQSTKSNTKPKNSTAPEKIRLFEEYREPSFIKSILSLEDCNIVLVGFYSPFFYVPFVPMVHISEGPDGKPLSEPVNKQEAERVNMSPSVHGRTIRYSIELRSQNFKLISEMQLEENEFLCDMKIMFGNFLVLCTSFPEGENKMTKGKLSIYSLVNIVPDPLNPHLTKKLKPICTEVFKNPCMCAVEIRSLIAVCIGTRLMIYEFNENTGLMAVGRTEISLLCTSMFATKNFITISDIYNGIYFFFLRPKNPLKLTLLGRSAKVKNCRFVCGIDFLDPISGALKLSLVTFSKHGVIRIFTFSPAAKSPGGEARLLHRAEIVTHLEHPLRYDSMELLNSNELLFFSSSVMMKITAVGLSKITEIQQEVTSCINNTCGIVSGDYLETSAYVGLDCRGVLVERILLEFFFFSPQLQNQVCNGLGMTYSTVSACIDSCISNIIHHK